MPNPGNFKGARLVFLNAQSDIYAEGIQNGQLADVVADIQLHYLKRFPMSLSPDAEPTKEWLDSVDDGVPEKDLEAPNPETMTDEAFSAAMDAYRKEINDTQALKDTIKRRLAYIYGKARNKDGSVDWTKKRGGPDPLAALAAKLAGIELRTPRARTPYNIWGPKHRPQCDPVFEKRVKDRNVPTHQHIALRSAIYKELFESLPVSEQEHWTQVAKKEHDKALEEMRLQQTQAASHSPQDYQKVISALPSIVEPILELLCEYTGWKFSMIGGGPEPADDGRLNMICIHSGVIPGTVKMDFGRHQRNAFKDHIYPSMGRFLKKCFNKEVCMARALPRNHGVATLADAVSDGSIDVGLHQYQDQRQVLEDEVARLASRKPKPPTGTPSPPVRFGPPIGRKKDRLLPTKDLPASLLPGPRTYRKSPLAQPPITAPTNNASTSESASTDAPPSNPTKSASIPASSFIPETQSLVEPTTTAPANVHSTPDPLLASSVSAAASSTSSTIQDAQTALQAVNPSSSVSAAACSISSTIPDAQNLLQQVQESTACTNLEFSLAAEAPASTAAAVPSTSSLSATPRVQGLAESAIAASDAGVGLISTLEKPLPSFSATEAAVAIAESPVQEAATAPVQNTDPLALPAAFPSLSPEEDADTSPNSLVSPGPSLPPSPAVSRSPSPETGYRRSSPPLSLPKLASQLLPTATSFLETTVTTALTSGPTPPGAATVPNIGEAIPASSTKRKAVTSEGRDESKKRPRGTDNSSAGKRKGNHADQSDIPKKKQRTRVRVFPTDRAFVVAESVDAPDWIVNALNLVAGVDLGWEWRRAVQLWIDIEADYEFSEDGVKPSAKGRPPAIMQWIKRARNHKFSPEIDNLDVFAAAYNSWWRFIQPEWRVSDDGLSLSQRTGEWTDVKYSGLNGFLSILAALCFWGKAAAGDEPAHADWTAALADAIYFLENIA